MESKMAKLLYLGGRLKRTSCPKKKPKGFFEIYVNTASIRVLKLREFCVEVNCGDGKTAPLVVAADNSFIYNQLLEAYIVLVHDECNGVLFKRARKSGKNWRKVCILFI